MGDGREEFVKENDNGDKDSALNGARLISMSVQEGNPSISSVYACSHQLQPR